jgi:hypothetical protein
LNFSTNIKNKPLSHGMPSSDKVSVTGSFSAEAIQSMGVDLVMDRVAKATEKSEKHFSKLSRCLSH